MTLYVPISAELLRALATGSLSLTRIKLRPWTNPQLLLAITVSAILQLRIALFALAQHFFDVLPHPLFEWSAMVVLAMWPVTFMEVGSLFWGNVYQVTSLLSQID